MSITIVASKKIEFLRQHLPNESLVDLQVFLRELCNLPLVDYLFLDLSYCLLKHHPWLDVAVYRQVLVNFLTDYYQLENCFAKEILESYCEQLRSVKNFTGRISLDDRDFVRYIFVMTLTSKSEQHLVLELGFGSMFLNCVRNFLQAVVHCRRPASFLYGFEALCYQELVELADRLVQTPDNLALYRLRYQLLLADQPWNNLSLTQLRSIFALLIHLADQPASERQLLSTFAKVNVTKIVTLLAEQDIIYRSDYRRRSVIWCLTALGRQLVEITDVVNVARRGRRSGAQQTAGCSSS